MQIEATNVNALVGILAFLIKDKKSSENLYKNIRKNICIGAHGLFAHTSNEIGAGIHEHTEDNALIGILADLLGEIDYAKDIFELINKNVPRDKDGLFGWWVGDKYSMPEGNCAMVLLAALLEGMKLTE